MKKIILSLALSISCLIVNAQSPEKINYQAVARDISGNPLVNQSLNITYEIRQSTPTGTSTYTETHTGISTNQFGLFTAEIGSGTPSVGTFAGINWGAGLYYLYVEVNGDPMGTSQLLSVPYALYAKQSANGPQGLPGNNSISIVTSEPAGANCQNGGNKIDVGTDDNGDNILQALEIDFTYYVCNGDSGSAAGDDWGNQVVISQGNNISGDGTTANPLSVFDNDTSATNEIQDLSISGNTIGITGGTGINLSPTAPGTGQVLTWNGTAWIAQNATSGGDNWGTQVVVSNTTLNGDGTAGNPLGVNGVLTDNQDLTLTGNTLSLTNDPTTVDLSPYLDNTDAQTLSINANTLSISNGNNVTLPTPPTYTAGTGINLSGNVITNTAPDQTVALTNGTGINVTGTYPNFTINNTSPATSISLTGIGMTTISGTNPNYTINTPAQTLTYTAPNLTLSNGGGTVTLPTSPWIKTGNFIHHNILTDSIGIGTNSPYSKLHISGSYSSVGNIGTFIDLQNTFGSSTSAAKVGIRFKTSNFPNGQHTKGGIIYSRNLSNARGDMLFLNNSNDDISEIDVANDVRLIIKNDGNIGIGTTAPTEKLHIQNGKLRVSNGGTSVADLYQTGTQTMLETGNLFAISPNGGSTSFTIDDGNADFFVQVRIQDGTEGLNRILTSNALGYASWVDLNTISPGATAWTKTGTNIYPTTLSDKVGIGTTTPLGRLDVITSTDLRGSQIQNSFTSNSDKYGIYANASGGGSGDNIGGWFESFGSPTGISYGVAGQSLASGSENRAVYGNATGATTNWAGYFESGNFYIQNNVAIGNTQHNHGMGASKVMSLTDFNNQPRLELAGYGVGTSSPATYTDHFKNDGTNTHHLARQTFGTFSAHNTGFTTLSLSNSGSLGVVMSAHAGKVGIGSIQYTNLNDILHVYENDNATDGENGALITVQNASGAYTSAATSEMAGIRFKVGSYVPNGMNKAGMFFRRNGTYGRGDLIFAINNVANTTNVTTADEVMRINSAGNVGIGTTIPNSKLHINESTTNPALRVQINGGTQFIVANNGSVALYNNAAPAFKLQLNVDGAAKPTTNTWTVASDKNLKKDIKPFTGGLADVLKINPVWFTYNGKAGMPDDTGVGVIAQELQKVAPFMVNEWEYVPQDEKTGEITGAPEKYLAVNNGAMTYMLINAIKEQQKMIEELQKEIQELKNK